MPASEKACPEALPTRTQDEQRLQGLFTRVAKIGTTSNKVAVEAWVENHQGWEKLTETSMVFAAIDWGGWTVRVRKTGEIQFSWHIGSSFSRKVQKKSY